MLADVPFPRGPRTRMCGCSIAAISAWLCRRRDRGSAHASRRPAPRSATRLQIATFSAGVLALLVASDWPIHDLGERYLFSVHMVQHTVYSIIAAPLLLMGTPTWLARWLLSPRWLLRTVRYLARLIPGDDHLQPRRDHHAHTGGRQRRAAPRAHALRGARAHRAVGVDRVDAAAEPAARSAATASARRMLFLFLQSVMPTVPASFLTFGDHPLYTSTRRCRACGASPP